MKKKILKSIAILMAAVMLLSAVPMFGSAADAQTEETIVLAQADGEKNGIDVFLSGVVIAAILNFINTILDSILLAPLQIFTTVRSN